MSFDMDKPTLPRHRLSGIDAVAKTAVCSVCGLTPIRYRANRSSECMTVRNRNRNGEPGKSRSRAYRPKPANDMRRRQKMYGWDASFGPEEYARMLSAQGGGCAICGAIDPSRSLAVDHDHATGVVRGLLCAHCNTGLGHLGDSVERVQSALNYLLK